MKKTGVSFDLLVKSINHQIKDFLCRDVEIGLLAQTVENQPKFFANSMKVQIDLKPCDGIVARELHSYTL